MEILVARLQVELLRRLSQWCAGSATVALLRGCELAAILQILERCFEFAQNCFAAPDLFIDFFRGQVIRRSGFGF